MHERIKSVQAELKYYESLMAPLQRELKELMALQDRIDKRKRAELVVVQPVSCGCTCHRCAERRQECGYDVHFVAVRKTLAHKGLPVKGSSSSKGFSWTLSDGTEIDYDVDRWFGWGESEEDAILEALDVDEKDFI